METYVDMGNYKKMIKYSKKEQSKGKVLSTSTGLNDPAPYLHEEHQLIG